MSMIFDYYVCTRPQIDEWARALEQFDEYRLEQCTRQMSAVLSLRNVSQNEVVSLARCHAELTDSQAQPRFIKSIGRDGIACIFKFSPNVISAIAQLEVSEDLCQQWRETASRSHEAYLEFTPNLLNVEIARSLQALCQSSQSNPLDLYLIFYTQVQSAPLRTHVLDCPKSEAYDSSSPEELANR